MMPSLGDLPDELLLRVIAAIEDHGDAAALGRTNSHFLAMMDLPTRRKFRRVRFVPNATIQHALKVVLQVVRKPFLGNYVRYIELDCFMDFRLRNKFEKMTLSKDTIASEDLNMLYGAIHKTGIVTPDDKTSLDELLFPGPTRHYRDSPGHESREILAALLASLSPGLISISCCDLGRYIPKIVAYEHNGQVIREDQENPGSRNYLARFLQLKGRHPEDRSCLQKVRQVHYVADTCRYRDEREYAETDYYHCLNVIRRMPAVESVRFDASTDSEQHMTVRPPPRSANYSRLAFYHSSVRFSVLNAMLLSCKTLTHLTVQLGGRYMLGGHFNPLHPDRLLETLLQYRDTLQFLDINADNDLLFNELFEDWQPHRFGSEEPSAADDMEYAVEWADELPELAEAAASVTVDETIHDASQTVNNNNNNQQPASNDANDDNASKIPPPRLPRLHRLKHLGMGIYMLYAMARGFGQDKISAEKLTLVDHLPRNLESLRIYGVGSKHGNETEEMGLRLDEHVKTLMEQKTTKLPNLASVEGVDEHLPNGESVDHPDENKHLLWEREVEEWSEVEEEMEKEKLDKVENTM